MKLDEDIENESETHSDTESCSSSSRTRRNSSGRLAPREGTILNETIKAHAVEADEVLHSSMEEDDLVPGSLPRTHGKFSSTSLLPDHKPSTSTNLQFSTEIMHTPSPSSLARQHQNRIARQGRLGKAKSTPLALNQIHEERESDLDDSPANSPRVERTRKHLGGGVMKAKRTTRRLSPVPSGGSRRSSSCSSSDEDEIEKHMRRLKTTSGCKLKSRRSNTDDGGFDGDSGGGTGIGGGGSLGTRRLISSDKRSNGQSSSSNKSPPPKKENSGNDECLNLNLNGFAPLCEDLDVIVESNKENLDHNNLSSDVDETENRTKFEVCNGKRSPLIEENDLFSHKGDGENERNTSFIREKRTNSASKYIRTNECDAEIEKRTLNWNNTGVQQINKNKRNSSAEDGVNLELTDMSLQSKDNLNRVEDTKKNMRLLRNPTMHTVKSNCCQIF